MTVTTFHLSISDDYMLNYFTLVFQPQNSQAKLQNGAFIKILPFKHDNAIRENKPKWNKFDDFQELDFHGFRRYKHCIRVTLFVVLYQKTHRLEAYIKSKNRFSSSLSPWTVQIARPI